jgi:phytanoyl-CoA hydroxylase
VVVASRVEVVVSRFTSSFGGLWTDADDAAADVKSRRRNGQLTREDCELVERWRRDGYVILPGAVPADRCDEIARSIDDVLRNGHESARVFDAATGVTHDATPGIGATLRSPRVVDAYVPFTAARNALFSAPIVSALKVLFDAEPMLFQSLSFPRGSEQELHQDTAFVVVAAQPMSLIASWVALEDVRDGAGPLVYVPGSHRIPEWIFPGGRKHYDGPADGPEELARWYAHLQAACTALSLRTHRFLPRKGDVLLWHADLVHGGSPIIDPASTRKSLVGHYSPRSTKPHYFTVYPGNAEIVGVPGGGSYCSAYYYVR